MYTQEWEDCWGQEFTDGEKAQGSEGNYKVGQGHGEVAVLELIYTVSSRGYVCGTCL